MSRRVARIDSALSLIERTDSITVDAEAISRDMDAYAVDAKAAFDLVVAQMRAYNQSEGTKGSIDIAQEFELGVTAHRAKADSFTARMASIDGGIRSGKVRLSRVFIERLTPVQRRQFRQTLRPGVDKDYRNRLGPTLFPDVSIRYMTEKEWLAAHQACRPAADSAATARPSLLAQALSAAVPPLYAAERKPGKVLAAACYAACKASFGLACASCIASAGGAAVSAWNQLSACKSGCGSCHWYTPWRCACRAYCWTVFLATIA